MLKEYLNYKQACKLQDKINKILPETIECILVRSNDRLKNNELLIKNKYGHLKELSRNDDNNIKELINLIYDTCKRFHLSFTFHSHGLDYIYISIEVK